MLLVAKMPSNIGVDVEECNSFFMLNGSSVVRETANAIDTPLK
jgi:hypothetical protein